MARKYADMILEMVNDGIVDPEIVIRDCLKYMSETEIRAMAEAEGYVLIAKAEDNSRPN